MEEKCSPAVLDLDENCIINEKDENFTGEVCFPQLIAAVIGLLRGSGGRKF